KEYNTRSKVVKGAGPQSNPKSPLLSNIPKEGPKKEASAKIPVVPKKNHTPPHAPIVKNPVPPNECVGFPSNVALPRNVPYDISQVVSQIKFFVPIVDLLRIPEHKKRAFEYLGLKEERTALGRNVNIVETPPSIEKLEAPLASE
ncbi:hypothetical protein KI387_002632, partial [Taxus chinensis]